MTNDDNTIVQENNENNADETTGLVLTTDIKELSACERHIRVAIPREEVTKYFDKEIDELEKTAYVPGFRAGKAPKKLVEKRFKKECNERVKHILISDALSQIEKDSALTPISEPDLDIDSVILTEEGPFVFEFKIEVRPEFELPNWKGIKIEKPVRVFSAKDIDVAVERLLVSYGTLETSGAPAKARDYIITKLRFEKDGKILSEADREVIRIKPVLSFQDGAIQDFDKLMIGAQPGDVVRTQTTLTVETPNPELQGAVVDAVFEIIDVQYLKLPELNADMLHKLGRFEDVGELRDAVLDSLNRQLEFEQNRRVRQQITGQLTVAANWELPPQLLRRQSEREYRRAIYELQRSGYSEQEIQGQVNYLRRNASAVTAQALKEHFILERIAEIENVTDEPEDYETEIALIAAANNTTPRRVRAHVEKAGEMDILRNQVIERKVIKLISDHAAFKEVEFPYEEGSEEAIDLLASGSHVLNEATEADLKAVQNEWHEKKKIDPNTKKP